MPERGYTIDSGIMGLMLAFTMWLLGLPLFPEAKYYRLKCAKEATAEPASWKEIRRRLQLAEAGKWKEVFYPLLQEAGQLRSPGSHTEDPHADWISDVKSAENSAIAHARKKVTAAGKVKGGCLRTAAQVLKGGGLLAPCADSRPS